MRYYPIFLDVRGRRCAVVGGGRVAERKVQALLRAGASVHVISPAVTPRLALLAARKKIDLTPRAYRPGDLERPAPARVKRPRDVPPVLVFAATNDRATNHRIGIAAKGRGLFANIADSAAECDFVVPARVQRGQVHVAISTGGESPRLSAELRSKLDEIL